MTRFQLLLLPLTTVSSVFYGENSYVEIDEIDGLSYQVTHGVDWTEIARSVAVAVIHVGPGGKDVDVAPLPPMGEQQDDPPLDPNYPYYDQPDFQWETRDPQKGTAALVAPDMILTAGHMGLDLAILSFIFDYTWDSEKDALNKTVYDEEEIYRCDKVLLHKNDDDGDYAICQLDRPVLDREPLKMMPIKHASDVHMKQARMISAPDGIPLKFTSQGRIWAERPSLKVDDPTMDMVMGKIQTPRDLNPEGFFFHNLDNSGGSSGAPIFDAYTGEIIGIQSGGDDNWDDDGDFRTPIVGNLRTSNLDSGRGLTGEYGSLIPEEALDVIGEF